MFVKLLNFNTLYCLEHITSSVNYYYWTILERIGYISEESIVVQHATNWIAYAMTMKEIRDMSRKLLNKITH